MINTSRSDTVSPMEMLRIRLVADLIRSTNINKKYKFVYMSDLGAGRISPDLLRGVLTEHVPVVVRRVLKSNLKPVVILGDCGLYGFHCI